MDVVELPEGIAVCKFPLLSANRARVSAKRAVPRENPLEKWSIAKKWIFFFFLTFFILLVFHATSFSYLFKNITFNFSSNIVKDINSRWLFRFIHINRASFYFIIIYYYINSSRIYRLCFTTRPNIEECNSNYWF